MNLSSSLSVTKPDFSAILVTLAEIQEAAGAARGLLITERGNKVGIPFLEVQAKYRADIVQQVISTLTEAMSALSTQLGVPAGEKFPEHQDEQYHNDHWATEKCSRCLLETELGWRVKGVGGKTPEEHLKLRGYLEPAVLERVVILLLRIQDSKPPIPLALEALALIEGKSK
jgi:hypothetical protein